MPIMRLLRHALVAIIAAIALYLGIRYAQYQIARDSTSDRGNEEVAAVQYDLLTLNLLNEKNEYSSLGALMSEHQPRYVLANLWATWCAPCREELPLFEEIAQTVSLEKVLVVGIADDDFDKARGFIDSLGLTFYQLINDGSILNLPDYFGNVSAIPVTVLLDKDGNLIAHKFGAFHGNELIQFVEKHTDL